MPQKYTIGLHCASRHRAAVLAGVLGAITVGCITQPAERDDAQASMLDVAPAPMSANAATLADSVAIPSDDAPESDCAALFCAGSSLQLADYCNEPHARCPVDIADARAIACRNRVAEAAYQFQSSCGGASIRIQYAYGAIDYHYDAAGDLTAVTTVLRQASDACQTDVYLYGDPSCRAGALEQMSCS